MSRNKLGALPAQTIRDMMQAGLIPGACEENINPASLDLSLSGEIYEVEGIFLPRPEESVRDLLAKIGKKTHDLHKPLKKQTSYLARLNESLKLPRSVYAYCNPKSTTGRNDVHARVIADRMSRYDAASPAGFQGELWIALSPNSFPVKVQEGVALSQVRFFTGNTRFNELELEIAYAKHKLIWRRDGTFLPYDRIKIRDDDGSVLLTLNLEDELVGYECRKTSGVLDFSSVGTHNWRKFFKPVKTRNGAVRLLREHFYILSTYEAVRVPPPLACEMVSMDERTGEFRSHYAGYIDPGWGWGKSGEGCGRPLTLEVRPFEDLIVRHNQPIAKIRFEQLTAVPDMLYDTVSSHYTMQAAARLSKHFKMQ